MSTEHIAPLDIVDFHATVNRLSDVHSIEHRFEVIQYMLADGTAVARVDICAKVGQEVALGNREGAGACSVDVDWARRAASSSD